MNINLLVPEETAAEVKADVENAIREELGVDAGYLVEDDSRGLGANYEVAALIIGIINIPSAINGILYLAEKASNIILRLRNRGGVLLPEREALLINIKTLFSEEDLRRIRIIRSHGASVGMHERARLGDYPYLYSYVLVFDTAETYDEVHHILINDRGEVLSHEVLHANMYASFYGSDLCLYEYFRR